MKKIISFIFLTSCIVFSFFTLPKPLNDELTSISLANIEALAGGEYGSGTCWGCGAGGTNISCYGGPYMCGMSHGNVFGRS